MDDISPRTRAALVRLAARYHLSLEAVISRYLNNRAYADMLGETYRVSDLAASCAAYRSQGVRPI